MIKLKDQVYTDTTQFLVYDVHIQKINVKLHLVWNVRLNIITQKL